MATAASVASLLGQLHFLRGPQSARGTLAGFLATKREVEQLVVDEILRAVLGRVPGEGDRAAAAVAIEMGEVGAGTGQDLREGLGAARLPRAAVAVDAAALLALPPAGTPAEGDLSGATPAQAEEEAAEKMTAARSVLSVRCREAQARVSLQLRHRRTATATATGTSPRHLFQVPLQAAAAEGAVHLLL